MQPVVGGILEVAFGANAAFGNGCKLQPLCSHGDASSSRPDRAPAFKSSCAFSVSAGMKPDVAIETFHIDSPKARITAICTINDQRGDRAFPAADRFPPGGCTSNAELRHCRRSGSAKSGLESWARSYGPSLPRSVKSARSKSFAV